MAMAVWRIREAGVVLALGGILSGCGPNTGALDRAEARDPLVRKARARAEQGDSDGALACLNRALEKRPDLAQAHLEAALLYDDVQKDYVRAIYHYQRYLDLRPASDKQEMIREMIRKARLAFAGSLADQVPGLSDRIAALQEENARLKNELQAARRLPENVSAVSTGAAAAATGQVYRVQERETLSLIAAKVYRNPGRWKVIFDANRQVLASPDALRPGQTLVIPP